MSYVHFICQTKSAPINAFLCQDLLFRAMVGLVEASTRLYLGDFEPEAWSTE
jgi:hypothetical protein